MGFNQYRTYNFNVEGKSDEEIAKLEEFFNKSGWEWEVEGFI